VSATETPTPPAQAERRCPRCGAPLSAEQEWCLECGAAVGTRIAEPRGWRVPLAVVGSLLALALIALILVIVELSSPAEEITAVPQTPTPGAATTPAAPQTTPPPEEGGAAPTPSATPAPESATPSANLATWPQGKSAWTIVLNSSGTRDDAERLATELAGKGVPAVGVIDSDDFESLGPDSFVVFSGQYDSRALADEALAQIRDRAGGGSTRRIVPKKS
jgi:cell division septation protein DedD